jgi:hypothetical protein
MPRYLLFSRDPKAGQALDLARAAPGLRLDGVADGDHVLVEGEENALAALLSAHPRRLAMERIAEISWQTDAPPPPPSFPALPPAPSSTLPEPPEPPLPSSFRFA